MLRPVLLLCVAMVLTAADPPWPGWERTGTTARGDVELALWRQAGSTTGRAVLRNRTELEVRVEFRVAADLMNHRTYAVGIGPAGTLGLGEPLPVEIGTQIQPTIAVVRVDPVPIHESSGYVRLAEDLAGGVTAWIFRRADGGDRAWLVLRNGNDEAVEVTLRLTGLVDGREQTRRERIAANTVAGGRGEYPLEYRPPGTDRAEPVRVIVEGVQRVR